MTKVSTPLNHRPQPQKTSAQTRSIYQRALFDQAGCIHPDAYLQLVVDGDLPNTYWLEKMKFEVTPSSQATEKELISIALDALRELRKDEATPWRSATPDMAAIRYDIWEMPCGIKYRFGTPDITIRLTVADSRLRISLPHPNQWARAGLSWVQVWGLCCDQDKVNPTPWLNNRVCDCKEFFGTANLKSSSTADTANTTLFCRGKQS